MIVNSVIAYLSPNILSAYGPLQNLVCQWNILFWDKVKELMTTQMVFRKLMQGIS